MSRAPLFGLLILGAISLAGCADVPTDPDERADFEATNDPLEPMNRSVFDFNMAIDRAVMKPVANYYHDNVSYDVRHGVSNILTNATMPKVAANDLLAAKISRAGEALGRFMVNTTAGVFGYVDVVARDGGPKGHDADFGETLAVWGVPEGPYLMLPFFGPSNPRDTAARAVTWVAPDPTDSAITAAWSDAGEARMASSMLSDRSDFVEPLDDLERNSVDLYAAIRSLSRQKRQADIDEIEKAPAF